MHNNHIHSDSKKRRSFLTMLFTAGDIGRYMRLQQMKSFLIMILALLLAGCVSRVAMLQTDKPEGKQYRFIFGKMLLDYDEVKSLSPEARITNYEKQLNEILKKDQKTNSCSIVPGTINFGEPGSQGTAHVRCQNTVSVQAQEGIFNRDGSPFYSYILSYE